jgi:hypothetical protein
MAFLISKARLLIRRAVKKEKKDKYIGSCELKIPLSYMHHRWTGRRRLVNGHVPAVGGRRLEIRLICPEASTHGFARLGVVVAQGLTRTFRQGKCAVTRTKYAGLCEMLIFRTRHHVLSDRLP